MVALIAYSVVTILTTAATIWNAVIFKGQFYSAAIYLTSAKLNVVVCCVFSIITEFFRFFVIFCY